MLLGPGSYELSVAGELPDGFEAVVEQPLQVGARFGDVDDLGRPLLEVARYGLTGRQEIPLLALQPVPQGRGIRRQQAGTVCADAHRPEYEFVSRQVVEADDPRDAFDAAQGAEQTPTRKWWSQRFLILVIGRVGGLEVRLVHAGQAKPPTVELAPGSLGPDASGA